VYVMCFFPLSIDTRALAIWVDADWSMFILDQSAWAYIDNALVCRSSRFQMRNRILHQKTDWPTCLF